MKVFDGYRRIIVDELSLDPQASNKLTRLARRGSPRQHPEARAVPQKVKMTTIRILKMHTVSECLASKLYRVVLLAPVWSMHDSRVT